MRRTGVVYILASRRDGTLYAGVTADLPGRLEQHRSGTGSRFAARYGALQLVWYEDHDEIVRAITRDKTIKTWPRQWKMMAIEALNPDRPDLSSHWLLGHGERFGS